MLAKLLFIGSLVIHKLVGGTFPFNVTCVGDLSSISGVEQGNFLNLRIFLD